ncbi:MAG TPA: hypothetical protein VF664_16615, partial [Cystobacter sp.]
TFEDVTTHAGVGDHSVSLAVTMLDFDRDGHLDFFVANALTTHLPDYATPTPFNFFHLPAPEFPGDRRMLRFMHNGWHDADNGGLNALYRAGAMAPSRRWTPRRWGSRRRAGRSPSAPWT